MCRIHGHALTYRCAKGTLTLLGRDIAVPLRDRRLKLRILVDRTSIEVFAHDGGVSASFCFLPDAWDSPLVLLAQDSPCRIASLDVRHVRSALAALPASSGAA